MLNNRKRAFTLVEMMAVVVIIGLLAAVIAPKFFNQVGKAQVTAAKQDIEQIKNAVTMFRFDTNKLPQELRDLRKDPELKGWNGPYLQKKPVDPWDNDYQYRAPGDNDREFDIYSFGADGKEGGEGMDADIVSWQEDDDV
ncbi:MAG: type II secretion system major pseudopilin GspG [Acidobacteriota bacterium]|nr:type II secretion system major pseudopilin GspG [Acidobacteriota bacterium]